MSIKTKIYSIISRPGSNEKSLVEELPHLDKWEDTLDEHKQDIQDEYGQKFIDSIVLTEEELEMITKEFKQLKK